MFLIKTMYFPICSILPLTWALSVESTVAACPFYMLPLSMLKCKIAAMICNKHLKLDETVVEKKGFFFF